MAMASAAPPHYEERVSETGFTQPHAAPDVAPRDASTVILLRDRPAGDLEVFLLRRHGASTFMGGAYVFPGGKVDATDGVLLGDDVVLPPLSVRPGRTLTRAAAAASWVAAIREVHEEAGVLLARRLDGAPLDEAQRERLTTARAAEQPLAPLLAAEALVLAPELLLPWAHWITPSREPRRFDTQFFVARTPPDQVAEADARETTDGVWLTPAEAIARHEAGALFLPPPTLVNLDELARLPTVEAVFAEARARTVAPILPKLGVIGESMAILLPWDPLFASTEGEALELPGPHPMQGRVSRVFLDGERWRLG